MKCGYCEKDSGPNGICPECIKEKKIIVFDSVVAAVKNAEAQLPGIISIRHVVKYGDKFLLVGHINCEHCAYCSEQMLLVSSKAFVTGPHEPKEMYPEEA